MIDDSIFMQAAIEEGRKALPYCFPNPPVGCVIVSNNQIISRGYTNRPGEPHAEIMAIQAMPKTLKNISIYVTLEPCSFQGRTPSCALHLTSLKSILKKVVVGIIDPDKRNSGKGIAILKQAGIPVEVGLLSDIIHKELAPYLAT